MSPERFNHDSETLHGALGISEERRGELEEILDNILSSSDRLSRAIQQVWVDICGQLGLEERIYLTVRLATEIFALYMERLSGQAEQAEGG